MRIQSLIAMAVDTRLGTRDSRRLARHVSHCQPCRREAMAAGLDSAILTHVPLRKRAAAKVAGLLPFPLFERFRGSAATHAPMVSDGLSGGWGKLATAAAVVAAGVGVAGVGSQIVRHDSADAAPKRATATSSGAAAKGKARAQTATVTRTTGASSKPSPAKPAKKSASVSRSGSRGSSSQGGGGLTGSRPAASGSGSSGSTAGTPVTGSTPKLPKVPEIKVPTGSGGDATAPVKQVVNQVTQTVAPVTNPVTDTVHQVLPPPVDQTVNDVTDVVEDGTGINLP
jgi:hypothetical protein